MTLDAGALLAVDRSDRAMLARLVVAHAEGEALRTHAMIVAQIWRDAPGRQAVLARFLKAVEVVALTDALGRRAGELLRIAETSDPIDAALVLVAPDGDTVVTSDPDDLTHLAQTAERALSIVAC